MISLNFARRLPLSLALLVLTQCSKCKDDPTPADPASQLPPATQTGADTFGCLVNGRPYTPSGYNGTTNYAVLYEPGFQGGTLQIYTYRYLEKGGSKKQRISLGAINLSHTGTYQVGPAYGVGAGVTDEAKASPCDELRSDHTDTFSKGNLTITRLDLQAGILAGTFDFVLAQPGCDTLRVTQGRFDKRL